MRKFSVKNYRAFTLVELILYVALVGILLTAAAIFATDVVLGSIKGRVRAQVQSEARFALEKMRQEIVKGKSLDAIQNSVWVTNYNSNFIQKFNATTGALDTSLGAAGNISTGSVRGHGIVYDPVQNAIWVTGGTGVGYTQKYDAGTGAQIRFVGDNISGGGIRVAYDPKQNAIWAVGSSNSLIKVNAENGAIITNNIDTENRRAAAYDSANNAVWVSDNTGNQIQKFNATNGAVLTSVATNNGPKGIAYDSKQNAVWVANESAGTVQKFDASTNGSLTTINNVPGAYVLAYDPIQNAVWVAACAYDKLYKFDAAIGASAGVFNTGDCPHGITYDPVQNVIWVSNALSDNLQSFNAINGVLLGTYNTDDDPASVAYAFNCRFMLGDGTTRTSFSVNGDQKTSSLNTLQMCSKSGAGCSSSDTWTDLTSPEVEVSGFSCQNISSGTSLGEEAVKIQMTLKKKNPGGKKEFDAAVTVETSISLRL